MAMIRHCDRCKEPTGERDYYTVSVVSHNNRTSDEIETSRRVDELCEGCVNHVRRELLTSSISRVGEKRHA